MIARLLVVLPFSFALPEGGQFNIYQTNLDGYEVQVFPPFKTEVPVAEDESIEITIDGSPGFRANGIRVEFHKEQFDRRIDVECDPPFALMRRVVDSLLIRLRIVTRAANMVPVNFPQQVNWRLQYLNDDGTELESQEGFIKGLGGLVRHFSWTALTSDVWDQVNLLPDDFEAPPWVTLLLDAQRAMPDVGAAIVLAFTALEVCIAHILDGIAARSVTPQALWDWINDRDGDWRKQPSTVEQFDALLRILAGTSLKQDNDLWEAFQNLRDARNSFVHAGKPTIGTTVVDELKARQLIGKANDIVMSLRNTLPEEKRWTVYQFDFPVAGSTKLWPGDESSEEP